MSEIYHLAPKQRWKETTGDYFPEAYEKDGFVHATKEREMLLNIANHFYKSDPRDYVLLKISESLLSHEVKYEPPAPVGNAPPPAERSQILFPHIYGPINSMEFVYKASSAETSTEAQSVYDVFLSGQKRATYRMKDALSKHNSTAAAICKSQRRPLDLVAHCCGNRMQRLARWGTQKEATKDGTAATHEAFRVKPQGEPGVPRGGGGTVGDSV